MKTGLGVLLLCCLLLVVATGAVWAGPGSILVPVGGAVSAILPDPSAAVVYAADRDHDRVLAISTHDGSIAADMTWRRACVELHGDIPALQTAVEDLRYGRRG